MFNKQKKRKKHSMASNIVVVLVALVVSTIQEDGYASSSYLCLFI